MLHIRHRLRNIVRIGLFRFIFCHVIYFPIFSFFPTVFRSLFRSLFPSLFLIPFYLSFSQKSLLSFCFCCKRIDPCKFTFECMVKRKLSAIPGRYVTVYACGFAHCALTEFLFDIQTFGELNFRIRRGSSIIEVSGA